MFHLYFFKRADDGNCIASLPVLGYDIVKMDDLNLNDDGEFSEEIDREFVIKMTFKNHVYYFAADSAYMYERWYGVLKNIDV